MPVTDNGDLENQVEQGQKSLCILDQIYTKLDEAFGGGDELFTMEYPARNLNRFDYVYDSDDGQGIYTKPQSVIEAEFELGDGLYNLSTLNKGNNGNKLSLAWDTTINNFTPRLNGMLDLIVDRADIRFYLTEIIDVNLDGKPEKLSRMEVCNRLAMKYYKAKASRDQEVSLVKNKARQETDKDKRKSEFESFADWVSSTGLVQDQLLNSMFDDLVVRGNLHEIKTFLGYLNIKSAPELLEETKAAMRNSAKRSVDGSTVIYPTAITPSDWYKALEPNLSPFDLGQSPQSLRQQLKAAQAQYTNTLDQLSVMQMDNKAERVEELQKQVSDKQAKLNEAESELTLKKGLGIVQTAQSVLKVWYGSYAMIPAANVLKDKINNDKDAIEKAAGKGASNETIDAIKETVQQLGETYNSESDVIAKTEELQTLKTALALSETQDYTKQLALLESQKNKQLAKINSLTQSLEQAVAFEMNSDDQSKAERNQQLFPNPASEIDSMYSEIVINTSSKEMDSYSENSAGSSMSSGSASLFYRSQKSSSDAKSVSKMIDKASSIEIGMRVMKINIARGGWFNPVLLSNSGNFHQINQTCFSVGHTAEEIKKKGDLTAGKSETLPAYPVSLLIAKDVTFKIALDQSAMDSESRKAASSSIKRGGFLGFGGKSSSQSENSSSSLSTSESAEGMTIRIGGPQILGAFLQMSPKDNSTPYTSMQDNGVSIAQIKKEIDKLRGLDKPSDNVERIQDDEKDVN